MRHWTTEHYPDAVPLDLWELMRALVAERKSHLLLSLCRYKLEDIITQEAMLEEVEYMTQFNTKLDAYRFYGPLDSHLIQVGTRYGNEPEQYYSHHLSREIAGLFDLDPLNRDKKGK